MFASSPLKTIFAAVALIGLGFASAADAREQTVSARLSAPAAQTRVVADNAVWSCAGDTCQANPDHSGSVHSCRLFVREANAIVVAYGSLSEAQIASCNLSSSASRGADTMQARN